MNAHEQSGAIGIAQNGNLWVGGTPERGLRRIDPRTELPDLLRARPGTSLAYQFVDQPFELTLRVEPAHREAYVELGLGGQISPAQFQLADEALRSWADAQGIDPKQLSLTPEDLGVRITYLASQPPGEKSAPDCDFAVPFA